MKRMARLFMLLLVVILLPADAVASDFSPLSVMVDDMPQPFQEISLYKLEQIKLDEKLVKKAVEKYCLEPQREEKWILEINKCSIQDCVLLYREENGKGGSIAVDYTGAPCFAQEGNDSHQQASAVVKSFLDEIGLSGYEYPFYYCNEQFHTIAGTRWNEVTEEEYLTQGYNTAEWTRLGGAPVLVVVRFLLNDIPFGTSISWTEHSNTAGNGNPTPSAFFLVTSGGKIANIAIRNPVKTIKQRDSSEMLLPWETVLDIHRTSLVDRFCRGDQAGNTLVLRYVEMILLTDDKNISFPAWHFVFEEHIGDSFYARYDMRNRILEIGLYFHAYTGKQV